MRLLVTGGRAFGVVPSKQTQFKSSWRWNPEAKMLSADEHAALVEQRKRERERGHAELDRIWREDIGDDDILIIIEGGATGADEIARSWARLNNTPCYTYKANWEANGKAAGMIRNQTMLDDGKPDRVLAFPGGRGTADMVRRATKLALPVTMVVMEE